MDTIELKVEARTATGKGAARRLRATGHLPAVMYGKGKEPQPLSFEGRRFVDALLGPLGRNARFKLSGGGEADGRVVIAREIQRAPLGRQVTHVDLYELDEERSIIVTVPVNYTGTPMGVEEGGMFRKLRTAIEIRCLPANIPLQVDVATDSLEIGQTLSITDVEVGEDVEVFYVHEYAICRVLVPRGYEDEVVEGEEDEDLEGEEGEGEEDEGAAPAADSKKSGGDE